MKILHFDEITLKKRSTDRKESNFSIFLIDDLCFLDIDILIHNFSYLTPVFFQINSNK